MPRLITVTSGKGGVGKTNISVNIALCLAGQGHRICLFDVDLGLANINILLGLYPEYDLGDLILNGRSINDILIRNYKGIDIIPGSSGIEKIADLEPDKLQHLIRSFSEIDSKYDFFILDTSAGVSKNVISFCMISSEIILVITPEPTSLTDAYALLKILSLNGFAGAVMVTVNQCKNIQNAKMVFTKFKETVQKFLPIKVIPLGAIMQDSNVVKAVKEQKPFIYLNPDSIASSCIKNISRNLINKKAEGVEAFRLDAFWNKFLKVIKGPLKMTGSKAVKKPDAPPGTPKVEEHIQPPKPVAAEEKVQAAVNADSSQPLVDKSQVQDVGHADLIHEFIPFLKDHIKYMSSISQDIGAVRKFFENRRETPHEDVPTSGTFENTEATIIPLDFESFLGRRKMR